MIETNRTLQVRFFTLFDKITKELGKYDAFEIMINDDVYFLAQEYNIDVEDVEFSQLLKMYENNNNPDNF